ncbi:MAG: DUF1698 domain-containing protein [bacterium]|nr:DUF1698 domain-containing protein [bacterium]
MSEMSTQELKELLDKQHFRTNLEVVPGVFTGGKVEVKPAAENYLKIAKVNSVKGKRLLDIGSWDGGFSFFFERMGAEVAALDVMDPEKYGFNLLKGILKSKAEFHRMTVYDMNPENVGMFDLVLFSGVFYHLKHPLLALERINEVMNVGGIIFGSGTSSDHYFTQGEDNIQLADEFPRANDFPIAFYADGNFMKDKTNWVIPNQKCLENWFKRSGFEFIMVKTSAGARTASGERRSLARFVARKIGPPEKEHSYL